MMKNSIAFRLFISVLTVSLIVSVLVTAARAWLDYRAAMTNIEDQLKKIETVHLPVIIENLWVMDKKTVRIAMQGLLNIPHLKRVRIEDHGRVIIKVGSIGTEDALQRDFPLQYTYGDKTIQLGIMKIDLSMDEVYKELWVHIKIGLFYTTFFVFFVAFSIYFLFQMLLTRHLSSIASHVKLIGKGGFDKELLLEKRKTAPENPDEIDQIVSAINSMRIGLKNTFDELQSEKNKLESIFDAMHDGVYIVDQDYDIEYANPVLVAEFGPFEGRKCYSYFHDREDFCPWCKNPDVFAGKTVQWERTLTKTGRTYDLIDTPIRNADGSISKLEILRDITERKQVEETLRKSAQLAAVGQVASGIAHEINNPLATISASAEALLARIPRLRAESGKNTASEDTLNLFQDYLAMIMDEVNRSSQIIRDLLDFSRVREYVFTETDIKKMVSNTVRFLSIQSRMARHIFRVDVSPDLPHILADRDRLQQVLIILITNAVESMADGGEVSIHCGVDKKQKSVLLSVKDAGSGINEEAMDRIFEHFYTTKDLGSGTGLGLSIANSIISKHDGRIDVKANSNQGMTFTVVLPVTRLSDGDGNESKFN